MRLLIDAESAEVFVEGYIHHWRQAPADGPAQQGQLLRLLAAQGDDPKALGRYLLEVWESLGLFTKSFKIAYGELARQERDRYGDMLGEADRQRLALLDGLPDPGSDRNARFAKLGRKKLI